MRGMMIAAIALTLLTACGSSDRGLRDVRSATGGPDEFSVLPTRTLEMPSSFATLPPPTPGGTNLTDPTPTADAIAALGGRESARLAGGIPAGDVALVSATNRFGTQNDIRAVLASEDAAFRQRRSRLGLFGGAADRYFKAYAAMALDAYAELTRFRNLGIQVPSAPPAL